jgi:hypothetical protein
MRLVSLSQFSRPKPPNLNRAVGDMWNELWIRLRIGIHFSQKIVIIGVVRPLPSSQNLRMVATPPLLAFGRGRTLGARWL